MDPANEPIRGRSRHCQEPQEEVDQPRVAVHEPHTIAIGVGLTLRTFAPVGDSPRDNELSVAEGDDLGRGAIAHRLALSLAACSAAQYLDTPSAFRFRKSS